jgi:hypothetical protein
MKHETSQAPSRRKFIFLGLGTVAFFSVLKFLKTTKKKKAVTMLTQDGRLVEVNEDLLPAKRKKITNGELQNWIKPGK